MSIAFEMISESLNEIIEDFEKNDGKNLKREVMTEEKFIKAVKKNSDRRSIEAQRRKNFSVSVSRE